ncbi:SOUL family heme-binding protein [Erythrobacter litoralis]|uniref:SOUL family heme-binding protein n=1 Tax=Erythrobacter litoralis TaxID=39960 RepID=UPI000326A6EB
MLKFLSLAIGAAITAVGGTAIAQYSSVEEQAYERIASDGVIELRQYEPMIIAQTIHAGPRERALAAGFRRLADYIFAEDRPGAEIAMTSPVLQDQAEAIAMTAPVMQDGVGQGAWRTRFVMPRQYTMATLPAAPDYIQLQEVPTRTVAAITFSGRAGSEELGRQERALREWIETNGFEVIGGAEYAFYDAPMVPGPLRRNEVMIEVSTNE